MSKDQALGGLILALCVVLGLFFAATLFYPQWLSTIATTSEIQFWIIALPVFIVFIAIMAIGAWIGWTMATTPPPKPVEELTTEKEATADVTPET